MNKQPQFIRRFSVLVVLVLGLFYFGLSDDNFSAAAVPCCQHCPTYQDCFNTCGGGNQACLDHCYSQVDKCERICVVC